jgi:hypothetical protein
MQPRNKERNSITPEHIRFIFLIFLLMNKIAKESNENRSPDQHDNRQIKNYLIKSAIHCVIENRKATSGD